MEWTAEEWDAFEEERAAKRTAERQRREQRREDKEAAKEATAAAEAVAATGAQERSILEPSVMEDDTGELDYEEDQDMPVQTQLQVIPDISQTVRELFSSPEFTVQLAALLQSSLGKKEETPQGAPQTGNKEERGSREPSTESSSSSSSEQNREKTRSYRDRSPVSEGRRGRYGSPRARHSREADPDRDCGGRERRDRSRERRRQSRERRRRSRKRSRERRRRSREQSRERRRRSCERRSRSQE